VDAPVERKLEGPPIEASASRSVSVCSGPCRGFGAQDVYSGAHGDSFLSFRIGRGRVVGGGRPQCVVVVSCGSSEVARPWLRRSRSGHSVALDVGPLLAWLAQPCKLHQFPQDLVSSTSSLFSHLQTVSSFPFLPLCPGIPQLPVMSGQQCLRRLPCVLSRAPILRASARAVNRLTAARSYSATSKASSSGLLSQASRYVVRLSSCIPCSTSCRRPGQLASQRPWSMEQTRNYGMLEG
jgi:hypothetical protein